VATRRMTHRLASYSFLFATLVMTCCSFACPLFTLLADLQLVRPAYARAMKEILARRIIEMAQRGTTDQQELVAGATRFIATNYRLKTISPDIPVRPGTVLQVDADSA
jgi:hypothetical protein